ncbi:MAG TPA: hypothetical protein VHG08_22855 [Longimicrobium sp.]|nr:hypothetical protein [Longimicrobium sp.]
MKLRLKLEELQVTAFETTTEDPFARGTVRGEMTGLRCESERCPDTEYDCSNPCIATDDPSCGWSWCDPTCGMSCNGSCVDTCNCA